MKSCRRTNFDRLCPLEQQLLQFSLFLTSHSVLLTPSHTTQATEDHAPRGNHRPSNHCILSWKINFVLHLQQFMRHTLLRSSSVDRVFVLQVQDDRFSCTLHPHLVEGSQKHHLLPTGLSSQQQPIIRAIFLR